MLRGIPGWLSGWASAFSPGCDPGDLGSSPASGFLRGVCFCICLCLCLCLPLCLSWINKFKKRKKEMPESRDFAFSTSRKCINWSICICFTSLEDQNNSNHIFPECLQTASSGNKHFMCIILLNSYGYLVRWLLWTQFYRWSNWG